jgi:Caspase domain
MVRRLVLLLVAIVLSGTGVAASAKRVALVIANGRYANATALKNPVSDGQLIAASLRRAGFTSVDLRTDLTKTALEAELRAFGQKSDGAEVALIYYAGHGIEAGGQNYIIPVDARLERDRDLELEATRLDTVLLMSESAKLRIVVLDACRNNPFMASMQRTMRNRAVGRGLAAVEPEGETLVVYAAKAGATAADGAGANSPFAQALAKRIVQPGLEISLLFRSVRDDVLTQTGRQQEPFTYGSLSGTAFYFVPGAAVQAQAAAPPAVQTTQPSQVVPTFSAAASEALYWQGTLSANSERGYRDYLKRYPQGEFSSVATENLQRFIKPVQSPQTVQSRPQPRPQPVQPKPVQSSGGNDSGTFFAGMGLGNFSSGMSSAGSSSGGSSSDVARRFQFTPSPQIRKQVRNEFLASVRASDTSSATILAAFLPENDPFLNLDPEFRKNGLTSSNLADTLSVFVDFMKDVANGVENSGNARQFVALRNQFATFMAFDASLSTLTKAELQQRSDLAVMVTAYVAVGYAATKQVGPEAAKQYSDLIAQMGQKAMGIDLRKVRLTDNGYQF